MIHRENSDVFLTDDNIDERHHRLYQVHSICLSASHVSFFGRCLRHKELGRVGSWRASLETCKIWIVIHMASFFQTWKIEKNDPSPGMSRIGTLPPEIRLWSPMDQRDLTKSTSYFWSREARFDTIPNPSSIGLHEPFLFMEYHTISHKLPNCLVVRVISGAKSRLRGSSTSHGTQRKSEPRRGSQQWKRQGRRRQTRLGTGDQWISWSLHGRFIGGFNGDKMVMNGDQSHPTGDEIRVETPDFSHVSSEQVLVWYRPIW